MTETKAKRNGFLLTLCFSIFHVIVLNGAILKTGFLESNDRFLQYVDLILILVLLFSWVFGRTYGIDIFITKRRFFETQYLILFKITNWANVVFIVLFTVYEAYSVKDFWVLVFLVISLPIAFVVNSISCILTALIMYAVLLVFFKK